MAENTSIIIKGARVNNLKNIDVEIPRNQTRSHHRTVRFRKILTCFRYIICRGASAATWRA